MTDLPENQFHFGNFLVLQKNFYSRVFISENRVENRNIRFKRSRRAFTSLNRCRIKF
jgi:hypothetical protein